jgi:hypothetical protein
MTQEAKPARAATQRFDLLLLGVILLLALGVRFWGIDFGLPNEHARPDERHLIGYTLTIGGNKLNPGFFNYPSLYLYLLFASYGAYFALGRATGHFHSIRDLVAEYSISPGPLYLIDRGLAAFLGTATVALVYWIGKRAIGRRAGLLAAFLLSIAYLHVRDSHFGTVDVPVTFFATAAIALILKADEFRSPRAYLIAGFVSGMAVSTKYNAIALVVPLAVLFVARSHLEQKARANRSPLGLLAIVGGLVAGFLIGTPFSVLDWSTFVRDASFELIQKTHQAPDIDMGPGWLYHLRVTLPNGLGLPLLFGALAGIAIAFRKDARLALLLLGFPLAWYLGVGKSHFVFTRYAVPLVPMLCVFAAWALDAGASWLEQGLSESGLRQKLAKRAGLVWPMVVGLVVLPPVWNVVQWDRLVRRTDTRVLAADWVAAHAANGSSVGVVGPNYLRPQLLNDPAQLHRSNEAGEGRKLRNELRLAYLQRTGAVAFESFVFEEGRWHDILEPDYIPADPPSYVVLADHPVWKPDPGSMPSLGRDYVQVAAFDGFSPPLLDAVFDWQDAVYFPFAHFDGVTRPGPNLRIFKRVH